MKRPYQLDKQGGTVMTYKVVLRMEKGKLSQQVEAQSIKQAATKVIESAAVNWSEVRRIEITVKVLSPERFIDEHMSEAAS